MKSPVVRVTLSCVVFCKVCVVTLLDLAKSLMKGQLTNAAWLRVAALRSGFLVASTILLMIGRIKVMGAQLPVFTRYSCRSVSYLLHYEMSLWFFHWNAFDQSLAPAKAMTLWNSWKPTCLHSKHSCWECFLMEMCFLNVLLRCIIIFQFRSVKCNQTTA